MSLNKGETWITGTDALIEYVDDLVLQNEAPLNVFNFGIGAYTNERLLSTIAANNNGLADFLGNEELEEMITEFYLLIRNPVSARTMYVLGLVYTKLDNDNLAISEFKKAIGVFTNYMDAHWELANAYMRTGEKARALKHFEIVAEKDEDQMRIREAYELIQRLRYDF